MKEKIGRNDPCPCGSGKKYKACCMTAPTATGKKKFTASLISQTKQPIDLMERTFGNGIAKTRDDYVPPKITKGPLAL